MNTNFLKPLRIATVPFYNAWPLTRFLEEELPDAVLSSWNPSAMRQGLLADEIDLALMPVAELAALPEAVVHGDACIGARGPVKSVLMFSKVPITEIRQIALDAASRTCVTLSVAMLEKFYGITPETVPLDYEADLNRCDADAMVVIGDRALAFEPNAQVWNVRVDLGQWWCEKTGLPFVFAAWIGLKSFGKTLEAKLNTARDRGIAAIDTIILEKMENAKKTEKPLLVDESVLHDYFRNAVHYTIGPKERKGMNLFVNQFANRFVCPVAAKKIAQGD